MEKNLLITGSTSQVGINLLREIHKDYNRIYLQFRQMNQDFENLLTEINQPERITLLQADLSQDDDIEKMIESMLSFGSPPNQIVHLPFPKAYNKQFHKDKWGNYDLAWSVSVKSIVIILQALIPMMTKTQYGRIVFMLTSNTVNNPPSFQSSYVTVKYALLGLMKALSSEYIKKGITVNGISPNMMETKFLSELPQIIVEQNAFNSPLGRNVRVDEIIPIIQYLLSDAGGAMTGQNIAVTGGL
mgnify:CR=1 FL=1